MQQNNIQLTVFFQSPFWVGVYERHSGGMLEVCKITFGAEPSDSQLYQFLLEHWRELQFSPPLEDSPLPTQPKNPKRARRQIARQLAGQLGTGTKSQQAIKLAQQQGKAASKQKSRQQRQLEADQKFQQRRQKKKEKKRGH